jgi:hypothetical protein
MDVRSIHIAKIVGLSQYESMLEARLELEHLHTLTNQQLYTIGEELRMSDDVLPNCNLNTVI